MIISKLRRAFDVIIFYDLNEKVSGKAQNQRIWAITKKTFQVVDFQDFICITKEGSFMSYHSISFFFFCEKGLLFVTYMRFIFRANGNINLILNYFQFLIALLCFRRSSSWFFLKFSFIFLSFSLYLNSFLRQQM